VCKWFVAKIHIKFDLLDHFITSAAAWSDT
jgi:hypothetical protein